MSVKVHYFEPGTPSTRCGLQCWPEKNTDVEASTVQGYRIEITDNAEHVTCQRCLRAARGGT